MFLLLILSLRGMPDFKLFTDQSDISLYLIPTVREELLDH